MSNEINFNWNSDVDKDLKESIQDGIKSLLKIVQAKLRGVNSIHISLTMNDIKTEIKGVIRCDKHKEPIGLFTWKSDQERGSINFDINNGPFHDDTL